MAQYNPVINAVEIDSNGNPVTRVAQPVSALTTEYGTSTQLLPPSREENGIMRWRFHLWEKACTFQPDCWLSWFCSCFQLGQISAKLHALGNYGCTLGYKPIVIIAVLLFLLDQIVSEDGSSGTWQMFFLFIVACQLRAHVRHIRGIEGDPMRDCFATLCCLPCSVSQMVGEMWKEPSQHPGCHIGADQGEVP